MNDEACVTNLKKDNDMLHTRLTFLTLSFCSLTGLTFSKMWATSFMINLIMSSLFSMQRLTSNRCSRYLESNF